MFCSAGRLARLVAAWPGLEEVAAAGSPLQFTSLQIATNATLVDNRRLAGVLGNASTDGPARCLDENPLYLSSHATAGADTNWTHPAAALGGQQPPCAELARQVADRPHRFRARWDERATLLFDTDTFVLHVLSPEEAEDCGIAPT